jgi:predicted enzyme related to lactoylglutathione lyase
MDFDGVSYEVIKNGERSNGGIMGQPEQLAGAPPFWNVYFGTEDLNQGIERTTALGGSLLAGPVSPPSGGQFAVLRDPQGAAFSLYAGHFDT